MRDDARRNNWTIEEAEQPLELSADLCGDLMAILAPMDRSVVSPVMAAVSKERSHRRVLQGFWLGLSPVVVAVVVMMLYASGTVLPRSLSTQTSGSALRAPTAIAGFADAAPKGRLGSANFSTAICQPRSLRVLLGGDILHTQLLVTWLRTRHPDAALELENAAPGDTVILTLDADEAPGFTDLMVLHGFAGEMWSGLRTVAGCSLASWSSVIDSSALIICVIP